MCDKYAKPDDYKKILFSDAKILFGQSMSQPLPYDENTFDKYVRLEEFLKTPYDRDSGDFLEVGSKYPDESKEKPKIFPFCLENEKVFPDEFTPHIKNENLIIMLKIVN